MQANSLNMEWSSDGSVNFRYLAVVLLLCMMIGGLFPQVIQIVSHSMVYIVWALLWFLIATFWFQMPLHRLLKPMAPFFLWMACYLCWGTLAASYPIFQEGYRLAFRFGAVAFAMAIVTSSPRRFRFFASSVQFVLVVNLVVTLLLINNPSYQNMLFLNKLDVSADSDRFAGFWGNANGAGLVSLMILALSQWAAKVPAWLGRISGILIIYLTASRTATWTLVAMFLYYFFLVANTRTKIRTLSIMGAAAVAVFAFLSYSNISTSGAGTGRTPISRVLDLNESKTRERGEESRLDLIKDWIAILPREPWYGFGLFTLYGGEAQETILRPDLPGQGPHNLYVGIVLDVGFIGLITFLLVVGRQFIAVFRKPFDPPVHRSLLAFCVTILVFSMFNHNLFTDFPGWIAFSFIFLSTSCPALESSVQRAG